MPRDATRHFNYTTYKRTILRKKLALRWFRGQERISHVSGLPHCITPGLLSLRARDTDLRRILKVALILFSQLSGRRFGAVPCIRRSWRLVLLDSVVSGKKRLTPPPRSLLWPEGIFKGEGVCVCTF